MKISISKDANINYLARVVKIEKLNKHPNADRLQTTVVDFQNVIVGMDAKEGDIMVFFPVECQINKKYLAHSNSFRDKTLNVDPEKAGFFELKGRVKAVKLRGEKSMGYLAPLKTLEDFMGGEIEYKIGEEFDTIGDVLIMQKYCLPVQESRIKNKQGKKPRISRLVDGQFHFHVDTENLRKNAYRIDPEDNISITYKLHGTSFIVSNIPVKRKLNLLEKILLKLGVKIDTLEQDWVYASRKVCKNEYETKDKKGFYDTDIWGIAKEEIKEFVPAGFTFYGEIVGYLPSGKSIQAHYDYGCNQGEHKCFIYRITYTNKDGMVVDLSTDAIREWADAVGFNYVPHFYTGKAKDLFTELNTEQHWHENFIAELEKKYNDKNCFMSRNEVPEEGIVLRKETIFSFEAFKLKSYEFLEFESKMLDSGEADIESVN